MTAPRVRNGLEPGRNDACPCGSGRKHKQCCEAADIAVAARARQADAHYRRGIALERGGRVNDAVAAYRSAVATCEVPEALSRLGHIFLGLRRFDEAAAAFRAAALADPENPERRMDLVRSFLAENREAEAEAEARRVLAMDPRNADAHWLLGRMLSDTGRFEEAAEALERSTTLNPDQGVVFYELARAKTITEADRPLIRRMLGAARALARPGQPVEQVAMLQLALAKAFDDLKDFESAMRHIAAANRLKKGMAGLDRVALANQVDRLISRFSPSFIASTAAFDNPSERPILIVGPAPLGHHPGGADSLQPRSGRSRRRNAVLADAGTGLRPNGRSAGYSRPRSSHDVRVFGCAQRGVAGRGSGHRQEPF